MKDFRLLLLAVLVLAVGACDDFSDPPDTQVPPPDQGILPSEAVGRLPGEFAVSDDGAATYHVPIRVPKARNGLEPMLALDYNSRAPDGVLGRGWSLKGMSQITRCPKTIAQDGQTDGVFMNDSDRFCLDGERLVAVSGVYGRTGTEYRTEHDSFKKIVQTASSATGRMPTEFTVHHPDGRRAVYGGAVRVTGVQQVIGADGAPTVSRNVTVRWPVYTVEDRYGNRMVYQYRDFGAGGASEVLPSSIIYALHTSEDLFSRVVYFYYEPRAYDRSYFKAGVKFSLSQRLSRIDVSAPFQDAPAVGAALVRSYRIGYAPSDDVFPQDHLGSLRECDGAGVCKPSTQFSWTGQQEGFRVVDTGVRVPSNTTILVTDVDADGNSDILYADFWDTNKWRVLLSKPNTATPLVGPISTSLPPVRTTHHGLYQNTFSPRSIDFDNDQRQDILIYNWLGSWEIYSWDSASSDFRRVTSLDEDYHFPYGGRLDPEKWSDGSGDYRAFLPEAYSPPDGQPPAVDLDLDGDGLLDPILMGFISNAGSPSMSGDCPTNPSDYWGFMWRRHVNGSYDSADHAASIRPFRGSSCNILPGEHGLVFPMDVEGDGRTNLIAWGSERFGRRTVAAQLDASGRLQQQYLSLEPEEQLYHYVFPDLNGDGLTDICDPYSPTYPGRDARSVYCRLNTGRGFTPWYPANRSGGGHAPPAAYDPEPGSDEYPIPDPGLQVIDYNGDGLDDLIYPVGDLLRADKILLVSDGVGFTARFLSPADGYPLAGSYVARNSPPHPGGITYFTSFRTGDFDGDGLLDVLQTSATTENLELFIRNSEIPNVIDGITDGLRQLAAGSLKGGIEIDYGRLTESEPGAGQAPLYTPGAGCQYPQRCVRRGPVVVREHRFLNPESTRRFTHSYSDARTDLIGRGWLGVASHSVRDEQKNESTLTHYFDNATRIGTRYPYAGAPRLIEGRNTFVLYNTGSIFQVRERITQHGSLWQMVEGFSGKTYRVREQGSVVLDSQRPLPSGSALTLRSAERFVEEFDAFDNPIHSVVTTGAGDVYRSHDSYDNDTSSWLISKLRRSEQSAWVASGGGPVTRTTTYDYDAATGALTRTSIEPGSGAAGQRERLITDYTHDPVTGVLTDVVAVDGFGETRGASYGYDADRTFPTSMTNSLGQVTSMKFHMGFGVPLQVTDPNMLSYRASYDGFGRERAARMPDGYENYTYYWRESAAQPYTVTRWDNTGSQSEARHDCLGRVTNTRVLGFDGRWATTELAYDGLGRLASRTRPFFPGATPQREAYTYDELDRHVTTTRADGSTTQVQYDGLTTGYLDEDGDRHETVQDLNGRIVEVRDGFAQSDGPYTTRYSYGAFGTVSDIRDARGNVVHVDYDRLGRRIHRHDADSGDDWFRLNGFGDVLEREYPNGEIVQLQYDPLGRLRSRSHPDAFEEYSYDSGTGAAIGKLVRAERAVLSGDSPVSTKTHLGYTPLGQVASITLDLASESFVVQRDYDTRGRLSRVTYPAASASLPRFAVDMQYGAYGHLSTLLDARSAAPLLQVKQMNAEGRVESSTLGGKIQQLFQFYPATGRERSRDAWVPVCGALGCTSETTLQALRFSWERDGTLASRNDLVENREETYVHDDLDRLVSWTVKGNASPAPTTRQFRYDALGNLTEKVGVHLGYGEGGRGGPHAVTSEDGINDFNYDDRGRQLKAPGRELRYADLELPAEMSLHGGDNVAFVYDAFHERVAKRSASGELAVYFNGIYERRTSSSGDEEHIFVVPGAGRIRQLVAGGALVDEQANYLLEDQVSSVNVVVDGAGSEVERLRWSPFGERVDPAGRSLERSSTPRAVGFGAHEIDLPGLVNMRGRLYDSLRGRFISTDPMLRTMWVSQALNPYSYVENAPETLMDPTGMTLVDSPDLTMPPPQEPTGEGGPTPPPPTKPPPSTPPPSGGKPPPKDPAQQNEPNNDSGRSSARDSRDSQTLNPPPASSFQRPGGGMGMGRGEQPGEEEAACLVPGDVDCQAPPRPRPPSASLIEQFLNQSDTHLVQQSLTGHRISRAALNYLQQNGGISNDLMRGLNPRYSSWNCPATAAAASYFFDRGRVVAAGPGDQTTEFPLTRGSFSGNHSPGDFPGVVANLTNNTYLVARANRDNPPSGMSQHHYFLIARFQGDVYVVDPFMQVVSRGPEAVRAAINNMGADSFSTSWDMRVSAGRPDGLQRDLDALQP